MSILLRWIELSPTKVDVSTAGSLSLVAVEPQACCTTALWRYFYVFGVLCISIFLRGMHPGGGISYTRRGWHCLRSSLRSILQCHRFIFPHARQFKRIAGKFFRSKGLPSLFFCNISIWVCIDWAFGLIKGGIEIYRNPCLVRNDGRVWNSMHKWQSSTWCHRHQRLGRSKFHLSIEYSNHRRRNFSPE